MLRDHTIAHPLPALLVTLALLATTGCATKSLHNQDWFVMETPHFELVSSLDTDEMRFMARDLELFHGGAQYIVGRELPNPPKKTRVYAYDGRSLNRPFDVRGQSSHFIPDLVRPILVLRAGGSFQEDASEDTLHEYTHFLVRQGDRRRPLWYEEGIAQLASTIEPRKGHARVSPPRMDHVRTLRDWAKSSVDPTLDATEIFDWTHRDRERFIAESWALVHYATLAPDQRKAQDRPLARFRHALDSGAQQGQSARIALGSRGEKLSLAIREYISQDRLSYATVVPRNEWKASNATITPLDRATGRRYLGELALAMGRQEPALRYFRMVPPSVPGRDTGLAGALRIDGELDKARARIEPELKRAPDDAAVALEAARIYHALGEERVEARAAYLGEARRHYTRAAELDPNVPATRADHAATYLLDGEDARQGLPLITAAYRQLPGSLEIQLLFAQLEAKRGKRSPALLHASDVASRGHGLPIADDAQQLLDSLRRPEPR